MESKLDQEGAGELVKVLRTVGALPENLGWSPSTPFPGDLMPSSGLLGYCTNRGTYRQNTPSTKKLILF